MLNVLTLPVSVKVDIDKWVHVELTDIEPKVINKHQMGVQGLNIIISGRTIDEMLVDLDNQIKALYQKCFLSTTHLTDEELTSKNQLLTMIQDHDVRYQFTFDDFRPTTLNGKFKPITNAKFPYDR